MSEVLIGSVQVATPFTLDELVKLIRQVVREEVSAILDERGFYPEPTVIEPGSPVYEDLEELLKLKESGQLEFVSYEEVFGEGHVSA
jgi:hypothetical protein